MFYHDTVFYCIDLNANNDMPGPQWIMQMWQGRKQFGEASSVVFIFSPPLVNFCQKNIWTFEDTGCAFNPPAPDFGSRLKPDHPPSSETQLPLLLLCRPQVVVVGGWVGGWSPLQPPTISNHVHQLWGAQSGLTLNSTQLIKPWFMVMSWTYYRRRSILLGWKINNKVYK